MLIAGRSEVSRPDQVQCQWRAHLALGSRLAATPSHPHPATRDLPYPFTSTTYLICLSSPGPMRRVHWIVLLSSF